VTVRREPPESAFLVRHSALLAYDETDLFILPCALRFTSDDVRSGKSAMAGEGIMNNAG